jgi:hypothetical protein
VGNTDLFQFHAAAMSLMADTSDAMVDVIDSTYSYSSPSRYVYSVPSARWKPNGWMIVSYVNKQRPLQTRTFCELVYSVFFVLFEYILRVDT